MSIEPSSGFQVVVADAIHGAPATAEGCVGFIRRYGARIRADGSLVLPRLEEPATAADVEAGRAIFALKGKRRVWKMPQHPLAAEHNGKDGTVWQAEEVSRNGKWQRFFGFVGRDALLKVPAAEIVFPGEQPWVELLEHFDCKLVFAEKGVELWLRNRTGLDRKMPEGPAAFHLFWSGAKATAEEMRNGWPDEKRQWKAFPPKKVPLKASPLVAAGSIRASFAKFSRTKPGFYRVRFVVAGRKTYEHPFLVEGAR